QKKLIEKRKAALKKAIGLRIRKVRKSLDYTQEQMVDYFDCGRANYSRIEKGEVFPNPTMLKVLDEQFNVSMSWFLSGNGEMMKAPEEKEEFSKKTADDEIEEMELNALLDYIEQVPMVKHAILGFFLEYISKNKKIIEPYLEKAKNAEKLKRLLPGA
ncbi:MAG: helix-turn-helix transcriptional regulator, partial [bacterium]|nr:helix-turn-helix transcriptional regulator [bacterium]